MKTFKISVVGIALVTIAGVGAVSYWNRAGDTGGAPDQQVNELQVGNYRISGPHGHENLAIFFIHGPDTTAGKEFLTVQEALEQKKIVVHETGNVNELAVENLSDQDIFIQSGDILKGGKQDRMIAADFIVPPQSGKMPIASFCVEQGRWNNRGKEDIAKFDAAAYCCNNVQLKKAALEKGSQQQVWKAVETQQTLCVDNVRQMGIESYLCPVRSKESPSSLQLTLENESLGKVRDKYVKTLENRLDGKQDVIGYAMVLNGKVVSIDIYGSAALFRKLWPRVLQASAVEAVTEWQKDKKFEQPTIAAVENFFADTEGAKKKQEKDVSSRVKMVVHESEKTICFDALDNEQKAVSIHRTILAK